MSNLFNLGLGYGLGKSIGNAVFDDGKGNGGDPSKQPIVQQTEAEIVAAEKRYDEEAKKLEADAEAVKAAKRAKP